MQQFKSLNGTHRRAAKINEPKFSRSSLLVGLRFYCEDRRFSLQYCSNFIQAHPRVYRITFFLVTVSLRLTHSKTTNPVTVGTHYYGFECIYERILSIHIPYVFDKCL